MITDGQNRKRSSPDDAEKKRTVKACDRCKLKKIKCDGQIPCTRCQQRDTICHFGFATGRDEKSVSAAHVNQLQLHNEILVKAVKLMWERYAQPMMKHNSVKNPSIHHIVAALGVLQAKSGLVQVGFDTSLLDRLDLESHNSSADVSPGNNQLPESQYDRSTLPSFNLDRETVFSGMPFPGQLESSMEPDLVSSRTSSSATDTTWSSIGQLQDLDSFMPTLPRPTRTATLNRPNKPTMKISMPKPYLNDFVEEPSSYPSLPTSHMYSMPEAILPHLAAPLDMPALTPGLDWDNLMNTGNFHGDNMSWG